MPQTTEMTTDQFLGMPAQGTVPSVDATQDSTVPTQPSPIPDPPVKAPGFRSDAEVRNLMDRMKTEGKMTIDPRDRDQIFDDLKKGATVNIGGVEDKPSKHVVTMSSEDFLGTPAKKEESKNDTVDALKGTLLNTLTGIQDFQNMPGDMAKRVWNTLTQKTEPGRAMTPDEATIAKNLGYGDKAWGSMSALSADQIKNAARANPELPGILNKWGKDIGGETGEFLSNLNNIYRGVADNSIPSLVSKINPAAKERVRYAQVQAILASSQMLAHPEGHTKEQLDNALQVMDDYKKQAQQNKQSTVEALKEMGSAIKEHPGAATAGLVNALAQDPELIVAPIATAGRVGKALEGAGVAARTAAKAGAGAAEGAAINMAAYAAQEGANPEGNITAGGLKSNAAIGGVMGSALGAVAPNHVAPKAAERVEPPIGPLPANPIHADVIKATTAKIDTPDVRAVKIAVDKYTDAMAKGDADAMEAANESLHRLNSTDPEVRTAEIKAVNSAAKPRVKVTTDGKIPETPAAEAPQAKTEGAPTLPSTLSKANPTYFYGNKRFSPEFANDVDKAAYIIAGQKPSKREADFLKFVMDSTGLDEAGARAYGRTVRASMKQYALGNSGGKMPVPDHYSNLGNATQPEGAGVSAAPKPQDIPPNLGSGNRGAQGGRIDPELLKSLALRSGLVGAGATAGAYAFPEDREKGAILGGAAGLGLGAAMGRGDINAKGLGRLQKGAIGGVKAEGADLGKLDLAKAAEGKEPRLKIWRDTGWYKDIDNHWKFEIPDTEAKLDVGSLYDMVLEGKTRTLGDTLHHDSLWKSYPDVANTKIKAIKLPTDIGGYVDGKTGDIILNADPRAYGKGGTKNAMKQIILHEAQHKVQESENFARGGSPDNVQDLPAYHDEIKSRRDALLKEGISPDLLKVADLGSIMDSAGFSVYKRLKGEVEARNVQKRSLLTEDQLKYAPPWATEDVPSAKQVVTFHDRVAKSIVDDLRTKQDELDAAKKSHAEFEHIAATSDNPLAKEALAKSSADIKAREKEITDLRSSKNSLPEPTPVRETLDLPEQDKIVEGVKRGDRRSIETLYRHFAPILKKYASSFAKTIKENGSQLPLEAGELAHVALTKGIQNIDMFKGDSALGTWLISILRNEGLQELRKGESRIKPTSIFTADPNEPGVARELSGTNLGHGDIAEGTGGSGLKAGVEKKLATTETPESELSNAQTQKILSRTFKKMGSDQQKAMEDFYFNDKSVIDIAKSAGVPENTVLSWLRRGREKVKEAIERDHIAYKGVYNPLTGKEGGFVDPKLAIEMGKKLAIAGVGATVGMSLADKDHKVGGAIKGAGLALLVGAISPRAAVQGIRNAMKPGTRISMGAAADIHEVEIARASRYIAQIKYQIEQLAPTSASRERITRVLDGEKLPLSVKEQKAANIAKQFFADVGKLGTDAGVLKDTLENYVTHLWGKTKENQSILNQLLDSGGSRGLSTDTKFALKRSFPTIRAGEKAGLTPQTLDVSSILGIYGDSVVKAIANKRLLHTLRDTEIPGTKNKMMMPSSDAPKEYVSMQHPQLFGLRVHPDLAGPLRFYFETKTPNEISAALQGVNMAAKRMAVSFSAFHVKALFDAMLGAAKNPITAITTIYNVARGTDKALHEMLHGSVGDKTDLALQGGLKVQMRKGAAVDDDVSLQFYEGLNAVGKLADRMFPGMGKIFKGVAKVNRVADVIMWEKLHAAMKLNTFYGRFDSVKRNLANYSAKHPDFKMPSDVDIAKDVASFTNDSFGGLNWRRITENVKSHWGHELAQAAFSPKGRRAMQLLFFAPDWTLSTARAAMKAFGKGTGAGGVIHPRNVVDLHRNYLLRSAIIYSVAADVMNMQFTGHHFWENEDPTRIELGDGRTMQWSKHSMEAVHWFTDTQQQALNKLGIVPKELLTQMLGVEYLRANGEAPPMDSRIEHLLKNFVPISGQLDNGAGAAVSSALGFPIYGKPKKEGKYKTTSGKKSKRHYK